MELKRMIAAFSAAAICLSAAGCGNKEETDDSSSAETAAVREIEKASEVEKRTDDSAESSSEGSSSASDNSGREMVEITPEMTDDVPELKDLSLEVVEAVKNDDTEKFGKFSKSTEPEDVQMDMEYVGYGFNEIFGENLSSDIGDYTFTPTRTLRLDASARIAGLEDDVTDEALVELEVKNSSGETGTATMLFANYSDFGWVVKRTEPATFEELYYYSDPVYYKLYKLSSLTYTLQLLSGLVYEEEYGEDSGAFEGKLNGNFTSDPKYDTLTSDIFDDEQLETYRENMRKIISKYMPNSEGLVWSIGFEEGNSSVDKIYVAESADSEYVGYIPAEKIFSDEDYTGPDGITEGGIWTFAE